MRVTQKGCEGAPAPIIRRRSLCDRRLGSQQMLKKVRSFLWILPFFSFVVGYQLVRFLTHTVVVIVPPLVGLHMHDAIKILSADKLNVRILAEKEDPDSPEGIIISQTPGHGKKIKPHQSIFLVITRKPPKPKTPALGGLPIEDARAKVAQSRIVLDVYQAESSYPKDTCIAQDHVAGDELEQKSMSIYVSTGTTPLRIVPDLIGKRADEITRFFKPFGVKVEFIHQGADGTDKEHVCAQCTIVEQRPLAGSIVDLTKTPTIYVTTSS